MNFTQKLISALAISIATAQAVTIDTVYFAQSHVQEASHPYFHLVGNRDTVIKAHVVDPASPASPPVTAVLTLDGQTLNLPLSGPAFLPASIPNGLGVVQHSAANSFTALIPKAWVKSGLVVSVTAGAAQVNYPSLNIGAPTKVVMTMFDVQYFADTNGNYPPGWEVELEAKWPVAELEVRRIPHVIFTELVMPPQSGKPAVRTRSKADYTAQTGNPFDGEQAAALAWNGALKAAAGKSGRVSLYYTNIYGVAAGGQAGGFSGVGNGTSAGILHHELGHALSLPHAGDSSVYPYKGAMHGILPPAIYNETHAGPNWAFHLPTQAFIPCTVQAGNVGAKPVGTYKCDPMQGGGTGFQEPGYLMNHFSDYSVFKMRSYLEGHVVTWNSSLGQYASWNQTARDYTNVVTNNGVSYPIERDVPVISVMASIAAASHGVSMVYPPIGPFSGGLIRLFDPTVSTDRVAAQSIFSPPTGSDLCVRVTQGGVIKTYMLAASWEPSADPLSSSSLSTTALNLPASGGNITKIDLLLTPDVEDFGLPPNPQVLYSWPKSLVAVPKALTAVSTNTQITLTWTASSGATSYNIKRSLTSGGPYAQIGTSATTSYGDTTVTNGLTYHYVVSATTSAGESDDSVQASATAISPPAAPTGLVATPGNTAVGLTWTASFGATGYNVKRALTSNGTYTAIQSQSGTGFNDLTVINGIDYFYKISAFNEGGAGLDSAVAGPARPVGPPPVPIGLTTIAGDSNAALIWTASSGATSYQVKRSVVSGGPYIQLQSIAGTSFTDSTVINGSSYYYVVSATSAGGTSGDSAEALAAVSRTRNWDGGTANITAAGNGVSGGGSGTWNTTLTNWDIGASSHVAWTNGTNDTPLFGGAANTVTLGAPITVGGLRFTTSGYIVTGSSLTFGTAGNIFNSGTATLASEIAGGPTAAISKDGGGILILSGANSYSGGITVNAGTLRFNASTAIGGSGRSVTAANSTTIALASGYTLDNSFLNRLVENSNAFTINYLTTGTTVSSALDFSGATGANLPNAVLAASPTSINTIYNGPLTPGGNTYRLGNLNVSTAFLNIDLFTVSSALSEAGNSVAISGVAPVILTGTLTYGGTTTINPGAALGFATTNLDNMGGGTTSRSISVGSGATLLRTGGSLNNAFLQRIVATAQPFTIIANNAGSGNALDLTLFPNASLATWDNPGTVSFAFTGTITPGSNGYLFGSPRTRNFINLNNTNSLTGSHKLTVVTGSISKLKLNAANNFTGDTLLNAGVLHLAHNQALQNSAINTIGNGVIDATAATAPTLGGLYGSKKITDLFFTGYSSLTALTLNPGSGATHSYSGNITDSTPGIALNKTGAGTQILSGANTYSGPTIISAGTLRVDSPGSLPGVSEVTVSGGTLGGNGTIGGSVTVETNGSLAPGSTVGTLFITGNLDVSSKAGGTGKLRFDLAAPAAPRDQISVTGPLLMGMGVLGFSDFVFTDLGGLQAGIYKLITSGEIIGTLDPSPASRSGPVGSNIGTLQITGNDLELIVGSTYATWANGANFSTDANLDGVANGMAWLLGAANPANNAITLLPTFDNTSDPAYFIFTYRRSDAACTAANTTHAAQYSSTLNTWTDAVHDGTNIIITSTDNFYGANPRTDQVQVKIKRSLAVQNKLFIRLNVATDP